MGQLFSSSAPPRLVFQPTPFNERTVGRCAKLKQPYRTLPFYRNGHVETIVSSKIRSDRPVHYQRTLLDMPDGGLVSLDQEAGEALPADAPVLVLLPGLTGGSHDKYVKHMVEAARLHGYRGVVFNSRGTSDAPVRTPQFYSASYTGDMREVMKHVREAHPQSRLFAAGWSLGANILVRYLAEEGRGTTLQAAVSFCNPFDLVICDQNFHVGFNRIYDRNLARGLARIFALHKVAAHTNAEQAGSSAQDVFDDCPQYDVALAAAPRSIRDFDEAVTRRSFDWPSVDAYYAGSGSGQVIDRVSIPLLCIQAENDPIAVARAIPEEAIAANENCALVVTETGGHLGWSTSYRGAPWTDEVALEWLNLVKDDQGPEKAPPASGRVAELQPVSS